MKMVIKNGHVIDPANNIDKQADIAIENGKILQLGAIDKNFQADKTIDATRQWIIPGLVDICCRAHMQHSHGNIFYQEAHRALKRGITTICVPPDGDPIIDSTAGVWRLMQQSHISLPHVYPIGALTLELKGKSLSDLTGLAQAGCIAFSHGQKPLKDLQILRHCYDYAASFNLTMIIQPQDPWLAKNGIAHEGLVATKLGLRGIPETAETLSIAQHLLLIEQSGVRAHFTCLSSQGAVSQIAKAKAAGLPISADTAMHSLHLTENNLEHFNANCHVIPPLRTEQDREKLCQGVAEFTLDAICSDHRPLDSIAKLAPFGDTLPGMTAIDTFLSLGVSLVKQHQLSLSTLISALTHRPAQIFNLPVGTLSIGACADICIIDPLRTWIVEDKSLYSQANNTPFKGRELPGVVTHTLLNGELVHAL